MKGYRTKPRVDDQIFPWSIVDPDDREIAIVYDKSDAKLIAKALNDIPKAAAVDQIMKRAKG